MISFKDMSRRDRYLGVKMFQYAFLRSTAIRLGTKFYCPDWPGDGIFQLNDSDERSREPGVMPRSYIEPREYFGFSDKAMHIADNTEIQGFFQSEKYFIDPDSVKKWFSFKPGITDRVSSKYAHIDFSQSVGVHLRFGDKKYEPFYKLPETTYYRNALSRVKFKKNILIFSDEPRLARNTLQTIFGNKIIMDGNKDFEDLFLMIKCRNFICSISTFSWWAGWLNSWSDRIVVSPREWIRPGFRRQNNDLCRKEWITLRIARPLLDDWRFIRFRNRLTRAFQLSGSVQ